MATITQTGDKWRAQVRGPKVLRVLGRKSIAKTFATRREAVAWARQVETGLHEQRLVPAALTVAALIEQYRRMRLELGRPVNPASNVHYMLEHLVEDLGPHLVAELSPKRLGEWAALRKSQGAGGYTVNMELSQLGTAIRHTGAYLQVQLPDVVGLARPLLHYGQLITGGGRRTRRPTEDELASLLAHLDAREPVVADAVRVAAITGLRRGELLEVSRHVSHVGAKAPALHPEPGELACGAPVADGARRQADLLGHLIQREGEAAVLFGEEDGAPEGHG